MKLLDARFALGRALIEWRDAGGSIEDVVFAIEDLAMVAALHRKGCIDPSHISCDRCSDVRQWEYPEENRGAITPSTQAEGKQ